MQNNDLQDKCNSQPVEYSDSFVGVHYHNGIFDIKYPLGFDVVKLDDKSTDKKKLEKEYRKDILQLINILHHYKKNDKTNNVSSKTLLRDDKNNFPLYAYLFIFNWYHKYGYYIPREITYKKNTKGKINWNKTIKQITPFFSEDESVYLNYVTRKTNYNEEAIIAEINRFCVYQSFLKIGCLFTSKIPKKQNYKFRPKLYINTLNKKISQTFNDNELLLFKNMKLILQNESNIEDESEYFYGTEYFNNIWENLINEVYGIDKNSSDFLRPHVHWNVPGYTKKEFPLKPDTIMIPETEFTKNKIYILDAKYYKAGANLEDGNLPAAESILKQIVYAEKFKKDKKYQNYEIFNAFILPYNMQEQGVLKYLGYTEEDWLQEERNDPNKKYVTIQAIRMDTKQLMYNHKKATDDIFDELAKCIEKGFENKKE